MTWREIHRYLPLVQANYDEVLEILEQRAQRRPDTKANRRLLLDTYIHTRNHRLTAKRCGIGVNRVSQLLAAAIRCAREITGVPPPLPPATPATPATPQEAPMSPAPLTARVTIDPDAR